MQSEETSLEYDFSIESASSNMYDNSTDNDNSNDIEIHSSDKYGELYINESIHKISSSSSSQTNSINILPDTNLKPNETLILKSCKINKTKQSHDIPTFFDFNNYGLNLISSPNIMSIKPERPQAPVVVNPTPIWIPSSTASLASQTSLHSVPSTSSSSSSSPPSTYPFDLFSHISSTESTVSCQSFIEETYNNNNIQIPPSYLSKTMLKHNKYSEDRNELLSSCRSKYRVKVNDDGSKYDGDD